MKKEIIPSIIANSQQELDERISKVEDITKTFHLDVMDSKFVSNKSLNFNFLLPKLQYEAHLMIYYPEKWIEENAKKVDTIIFHIESTKNPEDIIHIIKTKGKKTGIALNPETPIDKIKKHIKEINKVVVMTVPPEKYGALFLPQTLSKVKELRKLYPKLDIEVDGGINQNTIKEACNAGANMFVVGSYFQNSSNVKEAIKKLEKQLK